MRDLIQVGDVVKNSGRFYTSDVSYPEFLRDAGVRWLAIEQLGEDSISLRTLYRLAGYETPNTSERPDHVYLAIPKHPKNEDWSIERDELFPLVQVDVRVSTKIEEGSK